MFSGVMTSPSSQTPCNSVSYSLPPSSSQTPSSSDSTSPPTQYDVFLSFRGIDTRNNFTSHLYDKLVCSGVRTFMDDPDLHPGEVIQIGLDEAIKASKIYVVVFSENYASSSWCLDELVKMYDCYETMKRSIIGVYYNIEPTVVRFQTGSFEKAFEKHQSRTTTSADMVKVWRLTLTNVAALSGKHVSAKRSGADIINEIVHEILLQIKPKTLYVARYPVGLDSRVKDIAELLLSSGMKGVIKFGIYGMGGVGKTTLAKALFNHLLLKESFKGSCFLANVREVCGTFKGLVSLQQQLIDDVLRSKEKHEVHNVEEGTKFIERFCSAKVLLLIDDIYDLKQYQSLIGPFSSGSVVIITTRDEDTLNKIKVDPSYRYMLEQLKQAESLALFTKYAFENAKPNNSLMELSEEILHLAGGLPIALEVFGSYLSIIKSEVGWKSYIKKLQRDPDSTIKEKLLISLNALESEDPVLKKLFLDIACFFIGRKKKYAVKILKSYYSYADHNIDILKKRCLLTIDNGNKLGMHDLLKDMGRDVARNKSRDDEPGKYSRLWLLKDILDVLQNHKGTEAIEGIIPESYCYPLTRFNRVSFPTKAFKPMSKLRLLYLSSVDLIGSFEQTFEDLRWLCWEACPLKCLPSEFYPQKLVILQLRHSRMKTMWNPNVVSHVFENLKTLDMSFSGLTITPDCTRLPSLETLKLKGCYSLEEVHISIGSLASLVCLDLDGCCRLRSLPNTICNLRVLEVLNITNCSSLEALPMELGNIQSLKELNACGVNVSKLPDSVGCLTNLVKLILDFDKNLETLPHTIGNLKALEHLSIRGHTSLKELPDSIGRLSKLVEIRLGDNNNLETLPNTICNLRSLEILDISGCNKVENFPDQLWKLTRLRELNAGGATLLKELPDIESSQIALSLKELNVYETGLTALPSGISHLSNLEGLYLSNLDLLFIAELPPNLKRLKANYCRSLKRLPNLSNLKQLEEFYLTGCISLTEILGLEELTSLTQFSLDGCKLSLPTYILTKRFFQILFQFGHQIAILAPFPSWISVRQSISRISLKLPRNVSHNLLGMILCIIFDVTEFTPYYTVKNTTSGLILSGSLDENALDSCMVIVPRSIFPIRDGDDSIELENAGAEILGINLFYKTENVEDEEEQEWKN